MFENVKTVYELKCKCNFYSMIYLLFGVVSSTLSLVVSILLFGIPLGYLFLILSMLLLLHAQIKIRALDAQAEQLANVMLISTPHVYIDGTHMNIFNLNKIDIALLFDDFDSAYDVFMYPHTIDNTLMKIELDFDDRLNVVGIGCTSIDTMLFRYMSSNNGEYQYVYR